MTEPAVPQPYIDTAQENPNRITLGPIETPAGDTTGIAILIADYPTQSLVQAHYTSTEALALAQQIRQLVAQIWPDVAQAFDRNHPDSG